METEKKISTFTANEKEAMEKLDKFEADMNERLEEGESISSIEYYEKLKVTDELEINSNIYIAKINQEDGTQKIGIYAVDSDNLIGYINEDGNVEFIDPLLRDLNLEITLDDLKELNIENLRAKSEELTPEELEKYVKGIEDGKVEEDQKEEDKESKEKSPEETNDELLAEEGQDLQITYYKEIKDKNLQKEFPELKEKTLGLAYSKALNQFIITEKTDKGLKIADEIKPSKPTMRSVISIDNDGDQVERKSPHALMKTNRKDIEMSVNIDTYGYPELGKTRVTPCGERVERPLDMQGKKRADYDVVKETDTRYENDEIAHGFKKGEEQGKETQTLETVIELEDGSTTTLENESSKDGVNAMQFLKIFNEIEEGRPWERLATAHMIVKEAQKAKVSPEEFLNKYNNAQGNTQEERIKNAHEEIEGEYMGNNNRKR